MKIERTPTKFDQFKGFRYHKRIKFDSVEAAIEAGFGGTLRMSTEAVIDDSITVPTGATVTASYREGESMSENTVHTHGTPVGYDGGIPYAAKKS